DPLPTKPLETALHTLQRDPDATPGDHSVIAYKDDKGKPRWASLFEVIRPDLKNSTVRFGMELRKKPTVGTVINLPDAAEHLHPHHHRVKVGAKRYHVLLRQDQKP